MRKTRTPALLALSLCLLQACGSLPGGDSSMQEVGTGGATAADSGTSESVPELTLNLPDQDCVCMPDEPVRDLTFLDRGFSALTDNDHIEAVTHFQRYQRLEKSPRADWEAGIAIAYISTLQDSPYFDQAAARKSFRRLQKDFDRSWEVDERALLLRMSLESFRVMYRHMDDLEDANGTLKEDLRKREEAIKRLRELTLGQKESRQ